MALTTNIKVRPVTLTDIAIKTASCRDIVTLSSPVTEQEGQMHGVVYFFGEINGQLGLWELDHDKHNTPIGFKFEVTPICCL